MRLCVLMFCLLQVPTGLAKAPPPSQFLDRTYVNVPKTAGAYGLLSTHYEPAQLERGVTTTWQVPGAPDALRLDIFVYPRGRVDEPTAVTEAMLDVESGLADVMKAGRYSTVKLAQPVPFLIVKPPPYFANDGAPKQFDLTPKPELHTETPGESATDPLAQAVAESIRIRSTNNHGLRESITIEAEGVRWRSAAFVFYRHLFLFKVRITVPDSEMTQEAFDALADAAVRELVPQIEVRNFGACATIEIAQSSGQDKEAAVQEGSVAIVRGITRIGEENCATAPGKRDSATADYERVIIEYPPDTWKSGN